MQRMFVYYKYKVLGYQRRYFGGRGGRWTKKQDLRRVNICKRKIEKCNFKRLKKTANTTLARKRISILFNSIFESPKYRDVTGVGVITPRISPKVDFGTRNSLAAKS